MMKLPASCLAYFLTRLNMGEERFYQNAVLECNVGFLSFLTGK
jgi:hypothetical protein